MAYEPKEWQCGEYINNRDLNRIEEGIQEALTKDCDCGYSCGSTYLEVFAETVEAVQEGSVFVAYGTADSELTDESIRVTIDGDSYILPRVNRENRNTRRAPQLSYYYGEWDFSQFIPVFTTYPITIEGTEGSDNIIIYTQTEGEHQVEIAVLRNTVTTTDCFKAAVKTVVQEGGGGDDCGYECGIGRTTLFEGSLTTENMEGFAVATFISSGAVDSESITVTIDGIEYELPKVAGISAYGEFSGGPVFTTYPCLVVFSGEGSMFATENPGTYSVKIETSSEVIRTTECFRKAVSSVIDKLEHLLDGEADGSLRSNTSAAEENGYALGTSAVALGSGSEASGNYSFAEGHNTTASGIDSHAEGSGTTASGDDSHAEGNGTTANAVYSHAEGVTSTASGYASHAEGGNTTASATGAHAEGSGTTASGGNSHAEGGATTASGYDSHTEGQNTIANHKCQHAFGMFNVADPSTATAENKGTYIEIVGNGTSASARSNARTLDWSGNETIAGTLTQSSDKRLKEHIEYLGDDAIEFVRALKPAHYIKDNAHHTGFYAQDVEEIDKWDCMTGEMNGYMTLGYIELIAPLVAYCHSLEERIAALEGR